jgi:hypothetical protein
MSVINGVNVVEYAKLLSEGTWKYIDASNKIYYFNLALDIIIYNA